VCGTASDAGSGLSDVKISLRKGSGNYWNGSSFSSASEVLLTTTGTTSWSYAFASSKFAADGSYVVHAVATDTAKNTTAVVTTFTYDNTAPSASLTLPAYLRNGMNVSGSYTDATSGVGSVSYAYCAGSSCTPATPLGTTSVVPFSLQWSAQPAGGAYRVQATAVDNAGNVGVPVIASTTIDNTSPTVTVGQAAGQADPTKTSPIKFTATFSEAVSALVASDVTLTSTAGGTVAVSGSGTTFAITVSGMTTSGTVSATIAANRVQDPAGNFNTASTSADNSVAWDVTPPTVPTAAIAPVGNATTANYLGNNIAYYVYATATDPAPASGVATVTADVSSITTGQTAVSMIAGSYTVGSTTYNYRSGSLISGGSLSGSTKSYTVRASDALGNITTLPGSVTLDKTAPSVISIPPRAVHNGDSLTSIVTDAGGSGIASVTYLYCAGTLCTPNTVIGTSGGPSPWSVTWTSMPADGTYNVRARGADNAGNVAVWDELTDIQNQAPAVQSVSLVNNNNTQGKLERDDEVVVQFTQFLNPASLCSAPGTGAFPANDFVNPQVDDGNNVVTVTVNNNAGSTGNDTLTVTSANCTLHFGVIDLGSNAFVTGAVTFKGSGSGESMVEWDPSIKTLTIALGTVSNSSLTATVGSASPKYTPSTSITNGFGNAIAGTAVNATGRF
jgi:hypothetical protein